MIQSYMYTYIHTIIHDTYIQYTYTYILYMHKPIACMHKPSTYYYHALAYIYQQFIGDIQHVKQTFRMTKALPI